MAELQTFVNGAYVSIPVCQCGCGERVGVARQNRPEYGHVKGQCVRFKRGHQRRLLGTKSYPVRTRRNGLSGTLLAHRQRAEMALGHPLPCGAEVHHADGTKSIASALVICPSRAYHSFLHARMRVKAAGGDPNTDRICCTCKAIKPIPEFVKNPKAFIGVDSICKDCCNARRRTAA